MSDFALAAQNAAAAGAPPLMNVDGQQFIRDSIDHEQAAVRSTESFFSDTLGEFGVFIVVFIIGACVACTVPYFVDFFLATCRAPRNRRYQVFQLGKGLLIFAALYVAFALIDVSFTAVLIATSIVTLPITYALQPLLVQYFAGFWLQATTIFEEHHRVRIADQDIVIISLGTFAIEGRHYLDPTNQHGAESDIERGERPGARPDAGTDEAGNVYADKTVFIPNDVVLRSVVTTWWRNPRSYVPAIANRSPIIAGARSLAVNDHRAPPQRRRLQLKDT